MSAPVFLADRGQLAAATPGARIAVTGPEARHARSAVRLRAGEPVELVDGEGRRVCGEVGASDARDTLVVEVRSVVDEPLPSPTFAVAQAIAKGEHAELAVDLMTQLGVDAIVPWQSARSISRWGDEKAQKGRAKWHAAAVAAAKQSRRSRVPAVEAPVDLPVLLDRVRDADAAILLHEEARWSFIDVPLPRSGEILLIVGPEGGIGDDERAALIAAGAREAVLGPMILRSSLAGAAALAVLASRLRWGAADVEGSGA